MKIELRFQKIVFNNFDDILASGRKLDLLIVVAVCKIAIAVSYWDKKK